MVKRRTYLPYKQLRCRHVSTSKLTSKGQLTLTKDVRDWLNLQSGDKFWGYLREDGTIPLQPLTVDVGELYGLLPKPLKPVSLEEMDAAIQ